MLPIVAAASTAPPIPFLIDIDQMSPRLSGDKSLASSGDGYVHGTILVFEPAPVKIGTDTLLVRLGSVAGTKHAGGGRRVGEC